MLKKGANPNVATTHCETPLYLAVMYGHAKVVDVLLTHGVHPDRCSEYGRACLMTAAETDRSDICFKLIDNGAKIDLPTPDNNETAFSIAIDRHHPKAAAIHFVAGSEFSNVDKGTIERFQQQGHKWPPTPAHLIEILHCRKKLGCVERRSCRCNLIRNDPSPLQDLSRDVIRRQLKANAKGYGINGLLTKLNLSEMLETFLCYGEEFTKIPSQKVDDEYRKSWEEGDGNPEEEKEVLAERFKKMREEL